MINKGNETLQEKTFQRVYNKTWQTSVLIITFHKNADQSAEDIEGEIFNMHIPEGIHFQGLGDMMMKMDRIYDLLDYPQTELKIREWDDSEKWAGTPLERDDDWNYEADAVEKFRTIINGNDSAVYVEARFRRYGSWQGILQVGKRKLTYRSALEFLHYMMGYIKEIQENINFTI